MKYINITYCKKQYTSKTLIRCTYFIFAFITLLIGMLIYPFFRGSNILVWNLLPKPELYNMLVIPIYNSHNILSIFIGSAPDGLWFLSGILFIRGIFLFESKSAFYIVFFYLIAASFEFGQLLNLIPGTFDIFDLLIMSSVALAEGIFYIFIKRRYYYDERND